MDVKKIIILFLTIILVQALTLSRASGKFSFNDSKGKYLDITLDGKNVGRYMYEFDPSSEETFFTTYKPYLHVFDAEGKALITKGIQEKYPHHRGIFLGWKVYTEDGKGYDLWHMKKVTKKSKKKGEKESKRSKGKEAGVSQVHQKFIVKEAGSDKAEIKSLVHWNKGANQPILIEERTMTFYSKPKGGYLLIDFHSLLKANAGDLTLGGDPEHAGVQFRPASEVNKKETLYIFPKENADPKKDVDYAWVGETFELNDKKYSVVMMNHPDNPKETIFSAYRDYGRFGAFPKVSIKSGSSLILKYRYLIAEGEMMDAGIIQEWCNKFTGRKDPVPATSIKKAVDKKKKKDKKK